MKLILILLLLTQNSFASSAIPGIGGGSGSKVLAVSFGGASENSLCSASPCTVYRSNVAGVTVTRAGAGDYTVDSGTYFTNKPICTAVTYGAGFAVLRIEAHTTANQNRFTHFISGSQSDGIGEVICVESI